MTLCDFQKVDGNLICSSCGHMRVDVGLPVYRECQSSKLEEKKGFDCIHRGRRIGKTQCKPCNGGRKLNVFRCGIHGECTVYSTGLTKVDKGYKRSCIACEDRKDHSKEEELE